MTGLLKSQLVRNRTLPDSTIASLPFNSGKESNFSRKEARSCAMQGDFACLGSRKTTMSKYLEGGYLVRAFIGFGDLGPAY